MILAAASLLFLALFLFVLGVARAGTRRQVVSGERLRAVADGRREWRHARPRAGGPGGPFWQDDRLCRRWPLLRRLELDLRGAGIAMPLGTFVGLVLVIGILIDDAVVVREVIYRHMEHGEDAVRAALDGTAEVALAVLATTLSILAVFVPVGFMRGMIGQFFSQFGLTVAIAVSVSLFIAFTVDPVLSSRMSRVVAYEDRNRLGRAILDFWQSVDDRYRTLLGWSLATARSRLKKFSIAPQQSS